MTIEILEKIVDVPYKGDSQYLDRDRSQWVRQYQPDIRAQKALARNKEKYSFGDEK